PPTTEGTERPFGPPGPLPELPAARAERERQERINQTTEGQIRGFQQQPPRNVTHEPANSAERIDNQIEQFRRGERRDDRRIDSFIEEFSRTHEPNLCYRYPYVFVGL